MQNLIRGAALLLVIAVGVAGLYGSSSLDPCASNEAGDPPTTLCEFLRAGQRGSPPDPNPEPPPPTPSLAPQPRVSMGERGVGYVAYLNSGNLWVHRLNGVAGPGAASLVAMNVQQDFDVAVGGTTPRVTWRSENGRILLAEWDEAGLFQSEREVVASGGDDPVLAADPHADTSNPFLAWRQGETQSGSVVTVIRGTQSLAPPFDSIVHYAQDEDVSANALFNVRAATISGGRRVLVWTASQRSDTSITHVHASRFANGDWSEARQLGLGPIVTGQAPALGMDAEGNAMVVWPQGMGLVYSLYDAQTDSWSLESTVPSEPGDHSDVQLDVAADGRAVVAWRADRGLEAAVYDDSRTDRWRGSGLLGPRDASDPRVATDSMGRAIVVWRADGRAHAREFEPASGWVSDTDLGETESPIDLDTNSRGLAVAVWWQNGLRSRVWNRADALAASFSVDPHPGVEGNSLFFNPIESAGPFPITTYEWDWEDDGAFDAGGITPFHAFEIAGTYTTRLRITDTAGQTATTTRTVNVARLGELSSQVLVHYVGPGTGSLEIHSNEPGFTPVVCTTSSPVGGATDSGTCSATVLAGYEITIIEEHDPADATFAGFVERRDACRIITTAPVPTGTSTSCHFIATSQDRAFEVSFARTPPSTHILRVQLHQARVGAGNIAGFIVNLPGPPVVNCHVENEMLVNDTGGLCNYTFGTGTTITLTVQPTAGGFFGWEGCDQASPSTFDCTVTLTEFRTVFARFFGG